MRVDWEDVKAGVMEKALRAKFTSYPDLKEHLMSTYPHPLVQMKPSDGYWGSGRAGEGLNMLGILLMKIRQELIDKKKEGTTQ